MVSPARASVLAILFATAATAAPVASAQRAGSDGPVNKYGNTLKRAPRPTSAAITEDDLKTRLYIFADDSMMGRQAGREGNMKGTAYIAAELARLGLEPGGDNGTFFQGLPYYLRYYTPESQLSVEGRTLRFGEDFIPMPAPGRPAVQEFDNVQIIYGGVADDTTQQISAAQANGRVVVLTTAPSQAMLQRSEAMVIQIGNPLPLVNVAGTLRVNDQTVDVNVSGRGGQAVADSVRAAVLAAAARGGGAGGRGAGGAARGGGARGGGARGGGGGRGGFGGGGGSQARFSGAAAIVLVDLDEMSPTARANATNPTQAVLVSGQGAVAAAPGAMLGPSASPPTIRISAPAAAALMGIEMRELLPGAAGRLLRGRLHFVDKHVPEYGRNVIAILRGSDPVLRSEFVAIGAHNDHTGFLAGGGFDHDSLKAFNDALTKLQIRGTDSLVAVPFAQRDEIKVNIDSLRRIRPARRDSVRNGADDDGSGSMAVLEIAEALALSRERPKRSVIFVWHTAEESGLNGSAYFTANPTVPRESIVAQINLDMIGRGRAEDLPGGGPDYLAVVGAGRLSSELAAKVEDVNKRQRRPLKLDYRFDQPTTWSGYNNIYGRSDHANYARYGIPIAFFFTGLHGDYHQLTDEPAYIDYPHYNRITNYVRDLLLDVANAPTRPRVDRPGQ